MKGIPKSSKTECCNWNAAIARHAKSGDVKTALQMYHDMQNQGIALDSFTLSSIFKACSEVKAIKQGRIMHVQAMEIRLHSELVVGNSIINMYAKCCSLNEAIKAFEIMPHHDVASWGAVLCACTTQDVPQLAIELFIRMHQEGIRPNKVLYLCIIKACSMIGDMDIIRIMHEQVIKSGFASDVVVGTSLVHMYMHCQCLKEAQRVFDDLPTRNIVTWSTLISGYANEGKELLALYMFAKMQEKEIKPHSHIFSSALKACGNIKDVYTGQLLHSYIVENGNELDVILRQSLADMYIKCERIDKAFQSLGFSANHENITSEIPIPIDVDPQTPLTLNRAVILCLLKNCNKSSHGRIIHDQIVRSYQHIDFEIDNALLLMYGKCGNIKDACHLFDNLMYCNIVSWGALISDSVLQGYNLQALDFFSRMQKEGLEPDLVIYSSVLKSCSNSGLVDTGRILHSQITWNGVQEDIVLKNGLIGMYAKCGSLHDADKIFRQLPVRDVMSYTAMMTGYTNEGLAYPVLQLYEKMQQEGVAADNYIYSCVMKACKSLGFLKHGQLLHSQVIELNMEKDEVIRNTLIHLYTTCGNLEDAWSNLDELTVQDRRSWTMIIAGNASKGLSNLEDQCYMTMQLSGIDFDDAIFTSFISTCSHTGMTEKVRQYLRLMRENHDIYPSFEHYSCMVDLYGRTGALNEAEDLLLTVPSPPDIIFYTSLMNNYKAYGNIKLLGSHSSPAHILMDI